MKTDPQAEPVIAQLVHITDLESDYLRRTEARLRAESPDPDWVRSMPNDDDRSEMLDAFVSRYGRLQDTVGDKLVPAMLKANLERLGSQLDNLLREFGVGATTRTLHPSA